MYLDHRSLRVPFFNLSYFRTFIYELWVEQAKLIGNMDLCTALAAFYHLCFSFNLKYPQVFTFERNFFEIYSIFNFSGG